MAKRKTLMDELREELVNDRGLNELYQHELAKLKLANQILAARQRLPQEPGGGAILRGAGRSCGERVGQS